MTLARLGAVLILAAVMAWSGVAKVTRNNRWRLQLTGYYLPRPLRIFGFLVLPWVEILFALQFGFRPAWAAAAVAGLMVVFSALVLRARAKQESNKVGCGCFGGSSLHDYRLLLGRNAGIAALAGVVLTAPGDVPRLPVPAVGAVGLLSLAALLWMAMQVVSHLRAEGRVPQL
jgi:hypothetical protein